VPIPKSSAAFLLALLLVIRRSGTSEATRGTRFSLRRRRVFPPLLAVLRRLLLAEETRGLRDGPGTCVVKDLGVSEGNEGEDRGDFISDTSGASGISLPVGWGVASTTLMNNGG